MIRPGRIDLREHFRPAGADEVSRMISRWYDTDAGDCAGAGMVAPAEVIEVCKRHERAEDAIADLVRCVAVAA